MSTPISFRPMDEIAGYPVRPGMFDLNGALAIPCGVNFTIHTHGGTACELLLFHRGEEAPYATLPFPESYKIGDVYSMIVFDLNIEEFEYAYRIDGPRNPSAGLLFDKTRFCWILMHVQSPVRMSGESKNRTLITPGW